MKLNYDSEIKFQHSLKYIFRTSGVICFILLLYSLMTMLIMFLLGTPPTTIEECFIMLNDNRFYGLLRLDILTVFIMPLYYVLFYALYRSLRKFDNEILNISIIITFAGLTLFLATPSVFSYLKLNDLYHSLENTTDKNNVLAAGNAILASDMWHGTGAIIGGILLQLGALLVSIIMLKSNVFSKTLSIIGIISHGLDLLRMLIGFISPTIGALLLAIGGTLYLIWFPMLGIQLINISKQNQLYDNRK